MNSANLRIVRLEQTEQGALGPLSINGKLFCWTCMPDNKDDHPQIPAGTFPIKRFHGTKHKNTFEIVVPGHKAVLFHVGNTEDDSEMCVLLGFSVGVSNGKRAVLESKPAFISFMNALNGVQEGSITIEDKY